MMICRAMWSKRDENCSLAELLISSVRLKIEDRLAAMNDVHFVMSCITGSRNGKGEKTVNPGIGFFIAYNDTDTCDESTLFNVSL